MRDAFGGVFMIKLFIVFIIIYVGFTAVALNYAKAFKAKSIVIEYLENNEISDLDHMSAYAENEMCNYFENEIVGKLNYVFPVNHQNGLEDNRCYNDIGISIVEMNSGGRNKLGVYYKVTTYFGFQLPFFDRLFRLSGRSGGDDLVGVWRIVGETRPIAFEKEA